MSEEDLESETYVCSCCNGVFIKGWTDEEALKESDYYFDKDAKKVIVCDDCFVEIMKFHEIELDYDKKAGKPLALSLGGSQR